MATFDESIVSVSGRLNHAWDFTFYKNNGEIANRVRTELGSALKDLRIDKDGDINVEIAEEGDFVITPGAAIAAGWLTNPKKLAVQKEVEQFANIIEVLAKSKGSFATEFYNIRLFFRFRPENSLSLLRERGFEGTLRLMLGENPSDIASLKFSTGRSKGKFFDSIELEASLKDVQLRYSRTGPGEEFNSYLTFVFAANLSGMLEELKPLAETLMTTERGLNLRSFLSDMK